jgi:hypothetical protein
MHSNITGVEYSPAQSNLQDIRLSWGSQPREFIRHRFKACNVGSLWFPGVPGNILIETHDNSFFHVIYRQDGKRIDIA